MQKEEVKSKTPDIILKDVGRNPYFYRARTKVAQKKLRMQVCLTSSQIKTRWIASQKKKNE